MKIRLMSEKSVSVPEYKKVIDIFKQSKCPNESLRNTFPERYRGVVFLSKKLKVVYFDSKSASAHKYEMEI